MAEALSKTGAEDSIDLESLSEQIPERICLIFKTQRFKFDSLCFVVDGHDPENFVCYLINRPYGTKVVNITGLSREEVELIKGEIPEAIIEEEDLIPVVFESEGLVEVVYDSVQDGVVSFVPTGINERNELQGRGSFTVPEDVFISVRARYEAEPYNIQFLTPKEASARKSMREARYKECLEKTRARELEVIRKEDSGVLGKKKSKTSEKTVFRVNNKSSRKKSKPPSIINRVDLANLQLRGVPESIVFEIRDKMNEVAALVSNNGGLPEGMTDVEFGRRWRKLFREILSLSSSKGYLKKNKDT